MTLKVPIWVNLNRTLKVSLNGSIKVPLGGFGEQKVYSILIHTKPVEIY